MTAKEFYRLVRRCLPEPSSRRRSGMGARRAARDAVRMKSDFPPDALCAVPCCGHRFDLHKGFYEQCSLCTENGARGYNVPGEHVFIPRKLAGGALNATEELAKYQAALKGEL